MKIVFAGYRPWALGAFIDVIDVCGLKDFDLVKTPKELEEIENCIIVGAGWSWIIPDRIIENNEVIALMHPSDLPDYAGGSPIQHQIIDGLSRTKASLFKVDSRLDAGPVFLKKEMSLEGGIKEVFDSLRKVTRELLIEFITKYPAIEPKAQSQNEMTVKKRLKPGDSFLSKSEIQHLTTKQLYNMIRCRENPYPNVYIEDETGRLYFEKVRYEKK